MHSGLMGSVMVADGDTLKVDSMTVLGLEAGRFHARSAWTQTGWGWHL